MAACARAVDQGDGSFLLVLDPAATDLTTCQYVVQSGAEIANSLFAMTAEDGALYSGSVISVWIIAYFARVVINLFKVSPE